jgi:hypothetical protein
MTPLNADQGPESINELTNRLCRQIEEASGDNLENDLQEFVGYLTQAIVQLILQNQELLEALKDLLETLGPGPWTAHQMIELLEWLKTSLNTVLQQQELEDFINNSEIVEGPGPWRREP